MVRFAQELKVTQGIPGHGDAAVYRGGAREILRRERKEIAQFELIGIEGNLFI